MDNYVGKDVFPTFFVINTVDKAFFKKSVCVLWENCQNNAKSLIILHIYKSICLFERLRALLRNELSQKDITLQK